MDIMDMMSTIRWPHGEDNMVSFDYQEYYHNSLTIPLFFCTITVFLAIFSLITLKRIMKLPRERAGVTHRFLVALPISLTCTVSISILLVSMLSLKHGIYLLAEKPGQEEQWSGQVTKIESVPLSPRYKDGNGYIMRASIVTVEGKEFYFMSADDIAIGDHLQLSYLPHSNMVLSFTSNTTTISPTVFQSDSSSRENTIFMAVYFGIFAVLLLAKPWVYNGTMSAKQLAEEKSWDQDLVRHNRAYITGLWIFTVLVVVVGALGVILFQNDTLPFACGMVLVVAISYSVMTNKNERITYNPNGITIYSLWGTPYFVPKSHLKSIEMTRESRILKPHVTWVVLKIQYVIIVKGKEVYQTQKFRQSSYIGLDRFMNYAQCYYGCEFSKDAKPSL